MFKIINNVAFKGKLLNGFPTFLFPLNFNISRKRIRSFRFLCKNFNIVQIPQICESKMIDFQNDKMNKINYSTESNYNPDYDLDKIYEYLIELMMEAGKTFNSLQENFERKSYQTKSSRLDLLTEADKIMEKTFLSNLSEKYPSHKFISEEQIESEFDGISKLTNDPTWILDPIDGTLNFVHYYPETCISIGLLIDKITEIGIVYNPTRNQMFTARRNQGAFLNGKKLSVSGEKYLKFALVATEYGKGLEYLEIVNENIKTIVTRAHGIRASGSAALNLAYVASGTLDAYYQIGAQVWDLVAGDLIVREAGGVVIDTNGEPLDIMAKRFIASSSYELACEISQTIKSYDMGRNDE